MQYPGRRLYLALASNMLSCVRVSLYASLLLLAVMLTAHAKDAKKPLDHDVYDFWNSISDKAISNDGRWVLYSLSPEDGDPELFVKNLESEQVHRIPLGMSGTFEDDARHVVFTLKARKQAVRAAKLAEREKDDPPRDGLGILDLSSGQVSLIERAKSFKLPKEASGFVAYLLTTGKEEPTEEKKNGKDTKEEGVPLVLRSLATGAEIRFEDVLEYAFSKNGRWLMYTASNKSGDADGIFVVDTASTKSIALLKGKGVYKQAVFDESGQQLAFVSRQDNVASDQPIFALYYSVFDDRKGWSAVQTLAKLDTAGIPAGWSVSENGELEFSNKGRRLFFGTAPRPVFEKDDADLKYEKAVLDVWNWKDQLIQPMQLMQIEEERKRSYRAVVHLATKRVVQLADELIPDVTVVAKGEADVMLANTDVPYRKRISWDWPEYFDVYLVDINTGRRIRLLTELNDKAVLSPEARYVTWWDSSELAWYAVATQGGKSVKITASIPHPFQDELHDTPSRPGAYGSAGWTARDTEFLVYDKHDIWAVDPAGVKKPRNITQGAGRAQNLRFRYVKLDPEEQSIDPKSALLLSATNISSKASGFYRGRVDGASQPRQLIMMDRKFSNPEKAKNSAKLLFTRESFQEFPDLWVSDPDFHKPQRISTANPQQSEYRWGTAELTHWTSLDGTALAGILYKPESFDPNKKYPLIVSFYERTSDRLHSHHPPEATWRRISIGFYVSRGYVVFVPDIHYKVGYPGESALNAVMPGVTSLVSKGFIDKDRIGLQNHSWGGYQICYLLTKTEIFAAAAAGASVSNMVSAYGGIRWRTGRSRMPQYEKGQSRIGGTLWEYPLRFIENSPIFHVEKMSTPLLMLHNDEDGSVPWYQSVELFLAGRRLGKPIWMLNYNGEGHGLLKFQNKRDLAIRFQQFFDHYLMGAPAPVWLERGVPAIEKGKTLGLEPAQTVTLKE